jgi:hypothetical protein
MHLLFRDVLNDPDRFMRGEDHDSGIPRADLAKVPILIVPLRHLFLFLQLTLVRLKIDLSLV